MGCISHQTCILQIVPEYSLGLKLVLSNAGYGNGLTNAYAGTVPLLAANPLLIYRTIPLALLDAVLH